MRHRICEGLTGIGNSEPIVLDNNVELKDKAFWDEFYEAAAKAFPLIQTRIWLFRFSFPIREVAI